MELLYIYIFDFKSLKNIDFLLSKSLEKCKYDFKNNLIEIVYKNNTDDSIYGNGITDVHAIVGANGVGKSTVFDFLVSLLNGQIDSSIGFILYSYKGDLYTNSIAIANSKSNLKVCLDDDLTVFKNSVNVVFASSTLDYINLASEPVKSAFVKNYSTSYLLSHSHDNYLNFEDGDIRRLKFIQAIGYFNVLENCKIISALSWLLENEKKLRLSLNFPSILTIKVIDPPPGRFSVYYNSIIQILEDNHGKRYSFYFFKSKFLVVNFFLFLEYYYNQPNVSEFYAIESELKYFVSILEKLPPKNKYKEFDSLYQSIIKRFGHLYVDYQSLLDLWHSIDTTELPISIGFSGDTLVYNFRDSGLQNRFLDWLLYYLQNSPFYSALDINVSHASDEQTSVSSGEYSLLSLVGKVIHAVDQKKYHNLFLFDEVDVNLHPEWQRKLVNIIIKIIQHKYYGRSSQIVFTTHSPFILSDIISENVLYLDKKINGEVYARKPKSQITFGANIYKMLSDSFFMKEAFIGDFALQFISEIIESIENYKNLESSKENIIRGKINLISDEVIRLTLIDMLESKTTI
ncbi:MAG: AAA family ATPase [Chitinophagaceae bacterium]|nr:AAA family ATPase [Chitinophagaceae bacterium]